MNLVNESLSSIDYLKIYSKFEDYVTYKPIPFTYKYNFKLHLLNKKMGFNQIAGLGTELERILNILKWADKNLKFNGNKIIEREFDNYTWFEIINIVKKKGHALNCRYIALLFTQILLSLNFRARFVICLPVELVTKERHCVTEVYLEEYKKWIVVDAAYGLMYFNKKGVPLNLIEMREYIVSDKRFRIITNSIEKNKFVWNSWINHIFRFQYSVYNGYDMFLRKKQKFVFLNPKDFLSYDEINNKIMKLQHFDNVRPFLEK